MKKLILVLALVAAIYGGLRQSEVRLPFSTEATSAGVEAITQAFDNRQSGIQVVGEGVVSAMLPDDNKGSRHQRFVLRLASGQTVLVAHNIDLAPRIAGLGNGDTVGFNGVYEWNAKGGVIHWTHHDPAGRHVAGWLRHGGQLFQ